MTMTRRLLLPTSSATRNICFRHQCHVRLLRFYTTGMALLTPLVASFNVPQPYEPPSWAQGRLTNTPTSGRLRLAHLPTPIHQIATDNRSKSSFLQLLHQYNISLLIKRDDWTGGVELGGNKIRKLEFLLAQAASGDYDSVVTIGGEQSNHCRATAAASRLLRLEPFLILRRTSRPPGPERKSDLGYVGNLLLDRMVGSTVFTCTPGEYGRIGSDALVARVCRHLSDEGKRPYPIPVGGSNGLGSWGYIEAVDEVLKQCDGEMSLDHIVFSCGSGGTAAGLALGMALAHESSPKDAPQVHAVGVCDDPDYFYDYVADIADQMGFVVPPGYGTSEQYIRKQMTVHQGKGLGYAQSTEEELDFMAAFALETGIVLDPVYSGKALFNFFKIIEEKPEPFRGQKILFWHTGGALGLYEKTDQLESKLVHQSTCHVLDVYGKGGGIDVSQPSS